MKRSALLLVGAILCLTVRAEDDVFVSYFRSSPSIQITVTTSLKDEKGVFVPIAQQQFSYNGSTGHIYTKVLQPERIPADEWDYLGKNLFFDHGTVWEQDVRKNEWSSYSCSGGQFLNYIYYWYSGAGLTTAMASEALQGSADYALTNNKSVLVIRPKRTSDMYQSVKLISLKRAKERLLQELIFISGSSRKGDKGEVLEKRLYAYDTKDLVDHTAVQIPATAPKKKNPLESRMTYP